VEIVRINTRRFAFYLVVAEEVEGFKHLFGVGKLNGVVPEFLLVVEKEKDGFLKVIKNQKQEKFCINKEGEMINTDSPASFSLGENTFEIGGCAKAELLDPKNNPDHRLIFLFLNNIPAALLI